MDVRNIEEYIKSFTSPFTTSDLIKGLGGSKLSIEEIKEILEIVNELATDGMLMHREIQGSYLYDNTPIIKKLTNY